MHSEIGGPRWEADNHFSMVVDIPHNYDFQEEGIQNLIPTQLPGASDSVRIAGRGGWERSLNFPYGGSLQYYLEDSPDHTYGWAKIYFRLGSNEEYIHLADTNATGHWAAYTLDGADGLEANNWLVNVKVEGWIGADSNDQNQLFKYSYAESNVHSIIYDSTIDNTWTQNFLDLRMYRLGQIRATGLEEITVISHGSYADGLHFLEIPDGVVSNCESPHFGESDLGAQKILIYSSSGVVTGFQVPDPHYIGYTHGTTYTANTGGFSFQVTSSEDIQ